MAASTDDRAEDGSVARTERPPTWLRPWLAQVLAVGVVSALLLSQLMLFVGLTVAFGAALPAVVGFALVPVLLYVLGTLTRHGSPLTETPGARLGWAVLVTVGGTALTGFAFFQLRGSGGELARDLSDTYLLFGVAMALVTGCLSRPRPVRLVSAALTVLAVAALAVLPD